MKDEMSVTMVGFDWSTTQRQCLDCTESTRIPSVNMGATSLPRLVVKSPLLQ